MLKYRWAKGLTVLLFLLLFTTPALSQNNLLSHVTLRQYPSGSFSVRYGGIRGFITNQLTSQFSSLHKEWVLYNFVDDPLAAREELFQMRHAQRDIERGGAWFNRRWWHSLSEENGGAPTHHISVFRGNKRHLIDVGFAHITSDLRFNLREYRVNITHAFTPSSYEYPSLHEWHLNFRPRLNFSTSTIIRNISAALVFEYSHKSERLIEINFYVGYSIRLRTFVGISVSFLQW